MDLLLDTNILIDHFGNRPEFASNAHKVFAMGLFGDARLWATSNSFTDAFYLLRKHADPHAVQTALRNSLSVLNVCSVGSDDITQTLEQSWTDMEDCLVAMCAEKLHATYIITRDAHGFSGSKVPAVDPAALLELMRERGIGYDYIDW